MKKLIFFLSLCYAVSACASADVVEVIDGDSLKINGHSVRLKGIDAPEFDQICYDENDKAYSCGEDAKNYLQKMLNDGYKKGESVTCKKIAKDKYKRDLSVCYIGKREINRTLVQKGLAISYKGKDYTKEQKIAKKQKKGLWRGRFMRPEIYRSVRKYEQKQKKLTK